MLEKVEEIYKEPISLEKKNHKSIKSLFNSKLRSRAPSREFNDPIYAGFDINEQNKEQANWGPWVVSNQTTLRHSHSLHSSIKKMAFSDPIQLHSLSVNKKHVIPYTQEYKSRSPSRNELPEIKEKGKTNFLQIKLGQTDQKSNKSMATKQLKFKPRITVTRTDQTYFRRPQDQYRHRLKLGTVVYNYCTNNDVDECLLNYHRRSDPHLQKINKQQAMTKYEGLKSFWNKKNSMINIKQT